MSRQEESVLILWLKDRLTHHGLGRATQVGCVIGIVVVWVGLGFELVFVVAGIA